MKRHLRNVVRDMELKVTADESENAEFKTSLSEWKEIIKTISAFSNAKGGTISVGLDDDGKPLGTEIGKNRIEILANRIKQNAIKYLIQYKKITNKKYQQINKIPRVTAKKDLSELVEKGILKLSGRGRGAFYVFQ